ncbi:MAG: hypothetical protein KM310_00145 [Clostridiales bacterium]|nr:hypothetical protein [Clostridiales bacterium]
MDLLFSPQMDYLTLDEAGALLRLLRALNQLDKPFLPDDDETLSRIVRLSPDEWRRLRPALIDGPMAPLTLTDEGITYLPLLRLFEASQKRKASARKAGQASASQRRNDRSTNVRTRSNDRSTNVRAFPSPHDKTAPIQANERSNDRSTNVERLYNLGFSLEEYLNLKNIKLYYSSKGKPIRFSATEEVASPSTIESFLANPSASTLVEDIVLRWNELAQKVGLPLWEALTPKRALLLISRLAEDPSRQDLSWWTTLFAIIEHTPFLHGQGNWGWRMSFDWLLAASERLHRVREGRYGKIHAQSPALQPAWQPPMGQDRIEYWRRLGVIP